MDLLNIILVPVVVTYALVMTVLFVYVFNYFYLAWLGWRERRSLVSAAPKEMDAWPRATVQLPIYNEWYVTERLIESAAALDYPRDLLEIQVLDDSTDETVSLIRRKVEQLRSQGINIVHLHRADRRGFKAGALADGLARSSGEYLAIFDADFIPQPDFLRRTIPYFDDDRVAFVQARWGHLNRDYSLLTYLQALSLDAHFAIDQPARAASGYFFNFNGTAGVWRKSAIQDAGGWQADTLTEDLDLSYRVFLRGWSARYAGEVEVPAELPVSFTAYRRQQHRWARGGLECAIRYIPMIWRVKLPLTYKLQATLHLTGYGLHFLTLALICLYPLLLVLAQEYPTLLEPVGIGLFMNVLVFAPTIYFIVGQKLLRRRWLLNLPLIFLMSVFSSGMILNTLRAALQILRRHDIPFERTPKYGITRRRQAWDKSRYHVKIDSLVIFEIALACLNSWTAWMSWQTDHYLIMIYAFLFAVGLLFTSGFTLLQSFSTRFAPDL
ncbi:MAG: glycosyltransferase [Chloroflexi bacterium]|nr:glycosyltransferase [Chloroflexota bacterium]